MGPELVKIGERYPNLFSIRPVESYRLSLLQKVRQMKLVD